MDQRQREAVLTPIFTSHMAHSVGVVVDGYDDSVTEAMITGSEDSFPMTFEHPGTVPEWCESAMSRPPEPTVYLRCRPGFALVVLPSSDHLIVQACSYDLDVAIEERGKGTLLVLSDVPRGVQPEVRGSFRASPPVSAKALASMLRTLSMASMRWRTLWNMSKTIAASPHYSWMTSMECCQMSQQPPSIAVLRSVPHDAKNLRRESLTR